MLKEELQKLKEPQSLDELFQDSKEGELFDRVNTSLQTSALGVRNEMMQGLQDTVSELVKEEVGKITVRNGVDGKTPSREELQSIIKPLIPEAPKVEKPEERELKIEDIGGLKGMIDNLSNRITSKRGGGGGSTMRVSNLSSQANSSTRTFTTEHRIGTAHLLFYSGFPNLFLPTTDYTTSGTTVTLGSNIDPPVAGQSLALIYEDAS